MALIRWEPVAELNSIQNEMNRLFNTFADPSGQSRGADVRRHWIPAMDLVEAGDHYVLRADLPGLSETDVKSVPVETAAEPRGRHARHQNPHPAESSPHSA